MTPFLEGNQNPQHPQHPPQNVDDLLEIASNEWISSYFTLIRVLLIVQKSGINSPVELGSLSHCFTTGFLHPRRPGLLNHQRYFREIKQAAKIYGEYESHFSGRKAWSLGWFHINSWQIHGTMDIMLFIYIYIYIIYINIHIKYIYMHISIIYVHIFIICFFISIYIHFPY